MSDRYRQTEVQTHKCNPVVGGCGEIVDVCVSIDKVSGVAGFTCPNCDKTQGPYPVGDD